MYFPREGNIKRLCDMMGKDCVCLMCRHYAQFHHQCQFKLYLDDSICDHPDNKCGSCEAHDCPVLRMGGSLSKRHLTMYDAQHAVESKVGSWHSKVRAYLSGRGNLAASMYDTYATTLPLEEIIDNLFENHKDKQTVVSVTLERR